MIEAGGFARRVIDSAGEGHYLFDIDPASVAAELHAFADRIAARQVSVTRVQTGQVIERGELCAQAIMVEFTELVPKASSDEEEKPSHG